MDLSTYRFRCSSLGLIMTDGRSKSEPLGETCKTHLVECFATAKYGREKDITNKYIQKGLAVEEDAITLYSLVKKEIFFKNEDRLNNDLIEGTPDLFRGETIRKADLIIDIKSSWDLFTFFNVLTKDVNKMYYWQLQGYMALSGAKEAKLVYCLVDTPETIIEDEKKRLLWKMGVTTSENPIYQEACEKIEKEMRFNDIPREERVIEFEVKRNDEHIEKLYDRVKLCREFLNEFANKHKLIEA